ncbi:hypothetical protein CFOL_v3_33706, partial [Cephalotus follicularis]
ETARAIALACRILKSGEEAAEPNRIEGAVFRALSDTEKEEIVEKISQSSPNDKLVLVQALKRRGHIVGVIGDGTNAAHALHEFWQCFTFLL